jgi:hypothetical protein
MEERFQPQLPLRVGNGASSQEGLRSQLRDAGELEPPLQRRTQDQHLPQRRAKRCH